jgi:formylglycine-generating enzyme required for sulfatase activity/tRNA A-37 threonylcarbamoyl transferase component Bud32
MVDGPNGLDLLLVVLARQTGMVARDDLAAGMEAWQDGGGSTAGRALADRGAMDAESYRLLEALAGKLLAAHGGDPARCLAALGFIGTVGAPLGEEVSPAFLATLASSAPAGEAHDAHATRFPTQGSYDTQSGSGGPPRSDVGADARPVVGREGRRVGPVSAASGCRFRILRPLARGGLGEVYLAHDEEVGRVVALKEIHDQHADHPESRARFLLEAEVTGSLEHPGIVPIYGLGQYPDGRPYYAMRFIQGDSLKEAIEQFHVADAPARDPGERALGLSKLLGRFIDVCEAIAFAHSKGVLHRDLKPGNIMLGKYGETLVVDWGLAKAAGRSGGAAGPGEELSSLGSGSAPSQTQVGSALGTPQFMSPEQADGRIEDLGPATDVYSLGATLYQLLAGQVPFGDRHVSVILDAVKRGIFPSPRRVNPRVPAALEAVCLKAMSLRPDDRYPGPKALAEDVERWLADEPVTAWREPWAVKARRWVGRRRTAVIAAAASLTVGLMAVGYVAYDDGVRRAGEAARRLAEARGHVEALAAAEIDAVPEILGQLDDDRLLVRDRLRSLASSEAPGADGRRHRLHAALALLPDEPGHLDSLTERLVQAATRPEEVVVICAILKSAGQAQAAVPRLRDALRSAGPACDDGQLRATAALAALAAEDPLWKALAAPIAARLARENPIRLGAWSEAFRPVAGVLTGPLRDGHFADRDRPEPERAAAFTLLAEFAPRDGAGLADLVALVPDADPAQFEQILGRLLTDPLRASELLTGRLMPPARPDPASADRRGRVAAALIRLGKADDVWPLLVQTPRPDLRTEIVHDIARFRVDVAEVAARLATEQDVSARRALVLALGEYDPASLPTEPRRALGDRLLGWYRDDPDAGIHGAVDWLLRRRWGRKADLDRVDSELAGAGPVGGRDWYVNGRRQTFAVVRGPVEFMEGSPPEEAGRHANEDGAHRVRIGRSFAVAAREVTVAQFVEFLRATDPDAVAAWIGDPEFRQHVPEPDCPIGRANWYEAAAYCNWLSRVEGIPEDQWCYPERIKSGMVLPADWLKKTGYRLPTEAEWEFACRAGTVTSRPYGESPKPLPGYAWSAENSGNRTHPVGLLKPNDLGLFDMLGNALEWTADTYLGTAVFDPDGSPVPDLGASDPRYPNRARVTKSQSASDPTIYMRSAARSRITPTQVNVFYGFRPVRTCP